VVRDPERLLANGMLERLQKRSKKAIENRRRTLRRAPGRHPEVALGRSSLLPGLHNRLSGRGVPGYRRNVGAPVETPGSEFWTSSRRSVPTSRRNGGSVERNVCLAGDKEELCPARWNENLSPVFGGVGEQWFLSEADQGRSRTRHSTPGVRGIERKDTPGRRFGFEVRLSRRVNPGVLLGPRAVDAVGGWAG